MAYRSSHRFARISPRKARIVIDLVRNEPVALALEHLKFLPNRGARYIEKVLRSAVANAEEQGARDVERMRVVEARVDEGPRIKRIQPRARGMANRILKRTSHIHLAIDV